MAAAKVAAAPPADAVINAGPVFKKPVPMEPPLTAFDPAYLERKAQLPEQIFKLKSGQQLSYFTEGPCHSMHHANLAALGRTTDR